MPSPHAWTLGEEEALTASALRRIRSRLLTTFGTYVGWGVGLGSCGVMTCSKKSRFSGHVKKTASSPNSFDSPQGKQRDCRPTEVKAVWEAADELTATEEVTLRDQGNRSTQHTRALF